jgi:hypothetical protein
LWLLLAFGVICVPLYTVIHLGQEIKAETYAEKPFDQAIARRVAAAVRQGIIRPDAFGVADLPLTFSAATGEGVITVTRAKKDLISVFFPTRSERLRGARLSLLQPAPDASRYHPDLGQSKRHHH